MVVTARQENTWTHTMTIENLNPRADDEHQENFDSAFLICYSAKHRSMASIPVFVMSGLINLFMKVGPSIGMRSI